MRRPASAAFDAELVELVGSCLDMPLYVAAIICMWVYALRQGGSGISFVGYFGAVFEVEGFVQVFSCWGPWSRSARGGWAQSDLHALGPGTTQRIRPRYPPNYVIVVIGWQVNRADGRHFRAEEQPRAEGRSGSRDRDPTAGRNSGTHDGFSRRGHISTCERSLRSTSRISRGDGLKIGLHFIAIQDHHNS